MIEVTFTKTSITPIPPEGHELAGYISRNERSLGIHDNIEARILLIENQPAVVLVNLDLLGVDSLLRNSVQKIAEKEIGQVKVICTATHTHSAPATLFTNFLLTFGSRAFRPDYFRYFEEKIEDALLNLTSSLVRSEIHIGKTRVEGVATDRNNPANKVDNEALLAKFVSQGKTCGFLMNYAVHPTVLGPENLLISKDLVEYVLSGLYSSLGVQVGLFLNGAAGNISTRFTRKRQTFDEAERLGTKIAEQLLRIKFKPHYIDALELASEEVNVTFKKYTPGEFQRLAEVQRNESRRSKAFYEGIEALKRIYPFLAEAVIPIKAEIVNLRIGSLCLVFVPFEIHSDISLSLKHKAKNMQIALVGYANEYYGYLLPQQSSLSYEYLMQFVNDETREEVISSVFDILDLDPSSLDA